MSSTPDNKRARIEKEEETPTSATTDKDVIMASTDTTTAKADEPLALYSPSTSSSLDSYKSLHATSIADVSSYWSNLAKSSLEWFAPFPEASALAGSFEDGSVSWFVGGKINACYNAVDRHCATRKDEVAIIWEGDDPSHVERITYDELRKMVCRIANALKAEGVRKGDVVTLYMPM